jgi:photosystem II stability/assembly factor-like uncharacterized protein
VAILAAALGVVLAFAVLRPDRGPGRGEQERGTIHVHALAVNPSDGALLIAAHTGLFRLAPTASKAERVGEREQDTMGFTVIGPNRFLGSGHPDLRDRRPSLLGLIASKDGGESWRPVSLYGKADFHILRARGERIVGYDASHGRVMSSNDDGRAWRAHRFDGPLVDMVFEPGGRQLLATTPSQLILSRDGGRSWGGLSETTGLLAWPRQDRLYLLAPDGQLWLSPDRGKRWRNLGEIGGHPAAFVVSGRRMYAALDDGAIKTSGDDGLSWRLLARPS